MKHRDVTNKTWGLHAKTTGFLGNFLGSTLEFQGFASIIRKFDSQTHNHKGPIFNRQIITDHVIHSPEERRKCWEIVVGLFISGSKSDVFINSDYL